MAFDLSQAREMALEILNAVDYDLYKEVLEEIEDDEDAVTLVDDITDIVEKYVKVNP